MNKGADFSEDKKHRYRLWRIWDHALPKVMCIGLNPSNANAEKNDPTINNLIAVLTRLGYGGFYMMNCYSYVTSDPKLLMHNPMSDKWNDNMLLVTAAICDGVVFAWGTFKVVSERGRDKELSEMFPLAKCFGKNLDGSPMHPMGLMYSGKLKTAQLINYNL